jgi:hypothetical protein
VLQRLCIAAVNATAASMNGLVQFKLGRLLDGRSAGFAPLRMRPA